MCEAWKHFLKNALSKIWERWIDSDLHLAFEGSTRCEPVPIASEQVLISGLQCIRMSQVRTHGTRQPSHCSISSMASDRQAFAFGNSVKDFEKQGTLKNLLECTQKNNGSVPAVGAGH